MAKVVKTLFKDAFKGEGSSKPAGRDCFYMDSSQSDIKLVIGEDLGTPNDLLDDWGTK